MNKKLRDLYLFLDKKQWLNFSILAVVATITSMLEFVMVLLIPFLTQFLLAENVTEAPFYLNWLSLDFNSIIYILLGIVVFKFFIDLFLNKKKQSFFIHLYCDYVKQLNLGYLALDYLAFKKINTNKATKDTLIATRDAVFGVERLFDSVQRIIIILALVCALIIYDAKTTLFIGVFTIVIIGLMLLVRKPQHKAGIQTDRAYEKIQILVSESFNSFKELKFAKTADDYPNNLRGKLKNLYHNKLKLLVLPGLPKVYIEIFIYVALLSAALFTNFNFLNPKEVLPSIVFYLFIIRKLLPAFNELMLFYLEFIGALPIMNRLNALSHFLKDKAEQKYPVLKEFEFQSIALKNISFAYNKEQKILKNVNFSVQKGEKIAILGRSGAGKSTLVEILGSLIHEYQGEIFLNGERCEDLRRYRNMINYVPQSYYMIDGTIAQNITSNGEQFDRYRLEKCTKVALVTDFAEGLAQGIHTSIGDKGGFISGGQRQRIAIARALYTEPQLLILDEATSSLDSFTENKVIDNIFKYYAESTLIFATHKLSAIINFDIVCYVENGNIVFRGTYNDFINSPYSKSYESMSKSNASLDKINSPS